ncbi:MAG: hypothetical protein KUF72_07695 [Candidatus Thiodiazotropha sp. (ex Ctena orbiculata)]|nr:hypothetical protein [Candidatus Thiodiazotropha taylori]
MKKLITVTLLSMTLSLVACSDSSGPNNSTTSNTTAPMVEPAVSGQGMEEGDQAAFEAAVDTANQAVPEKQ